MRRPDLVTCEGKSPFATMAQAKQAAKRMRRGTEKPIEAYRCLLCRSYHVGRARLRTTRKRLLREADRRWDDD